MNINAHKTGVKTTLICTTFNEAGSIRQWLSSLRAQSRLPEQIVIVDGGSSDETVECIDAFRKSSGVEIDLFVEPECNRKFCIGPIARGRNIAISRAHHDFIISTDAGCVMDKDFVRLICEAFEDGHDYVCGAYDLHEPNDYQESLRSSFIPNFSAVTFPRDFLPSSRSVGFAKHLWVSVGGYPEDSFTAEDTKFAQSLVHHSRSMAMQPNAVVFWRSPADRHELLKKCYAYGYGDGRQLLNIPQYLLRIVVFAVPPVWFLYNLMKKRSMEAWFIHLGQISGFLAGVFSLYWPRSADHRGSSN